jgi:hypothetical protein
VLFATARNALAFYALQAQWLGKKQLLAVRVGSTTLARLRAPITASCTVAINVDGRRWSIRQSTGKRMSGKLASKVGLTGLVTQLDLRAKPALRVEATPTTEDTRSSPTQTILRLAALAGILAALGLVLLRESRPRRWAANNRLHKPTLPDVFVGLVLVTWWIVGPVYPDDGWVTARQTNSLVSGGFSNYFNSHGANLPLGFWLEWLQRIVVGHTTTLLWQRIPSIVCLVALWIVARATLVLLVGRPQNRGNTVWWSVAAVFCVGATAFGVTLRPEPMNALLSAGVLVCMVKFARRPSHAPLVLAAVLIGLAVTEHPEGLISLAPMIASLPCTVRAFRLRTLDTWCVAAVGAALGAWTVILEFLGSDLQQRLADRRLIAIGSHAYGVSDEWLRYYWFPSTSSPLRREFVLLCILCFFGFLLRRRRSGRPGELLAVRSLPIGLALLSFEPSKWIWHFAPLLGICVVAVGVEVADWTNPGRHISSLRARLAAAVLFVATGWSALSQAKWGQLDLRTLKPGQPLPLLMPIGGFLVGLAGLAIFVWLGIAFVRGSHGAGHREWLSLSVALPILLVTLLAVSTAVFVGDALATAGSTPPRQSVDALLGATPCGLADDTVVPNVQGIAVAQPVTAVAHSAASRPAAPLQGVRIVRAISGSSGWYKLPRPPRAFGLYVGGAWKASDSILLTWGHVEGRSVTALESARVRPRNRVRATANAKWTFVPQSSLAARPGGASAVRVRMDGAAATRAFATSPVWYSYTRLAAWMQRRSTVTLMSPFGLEYMPCGQLPTMAWGVAQSPSLIVDWGGDASVTGATSPFLGVPDLFDVTQFPLGARPHLPRSVRAYSVSVDREDSIAPAIREQTKSGR